MSFKEDFPSFKLAIPQDTCRDCDKPLYCEKIITDNCIDKQRVKNAEHWLRTLPDYALEGYKKELGL